MEVVYFYKSELDETELRQNSIWGCRILLIWMPRMEMLKNINVSNENAQIWISPIERL